MSGLLFLGLLLDIACIVLCVKISKKKGKNPILYAILALFLPIIGVIVVLLIPEQMYSNNVPKNDAIINSQSSLKMDIPINKWYLDLPFEIVSNKLIVSEDKTKALFTLTMQNIGEKRIRSIYLKLACFDDTQEKVCENNVIDYAYQDLHVEKNQLFGETCIIELPSATTRNIDISFVKMAFSDGTVLRESEIKDKELLLNGEKIKDNRCTQMYFQNVFGYNYFSPNYLPKLTDTKWLCTCGRTNLNTEKCIRCNRTKNELMHAFSEDSIASYTKEFEEQSKEIKKENTNKLKKIAIVIGAFIGTVIVLSGIINIIETKNFEKKINTYISNEEYEQAFDEINLSNISFEEKEEYREKIIPYMRTQHKRLRNSSKINLALILNGIEYYISEDKIYSKEEGKDTKVLYSTSDYNQNLRSYWSIYANGCLFFIESEEYRDSNTFMKSHKFTTKSIDLQTGKIETLGSANSRGDIVKLDNGNIFIGQNLLDYYEGILYNPYTKDKTVGEDVIYEWQLNSAVYMN